MSKVDFKDCYDKVKNTYGIEEDLIITVVDKKISNNQNSYYSFFHPKSGKKLDCLFLKQNENETPYIKGYDFLYVQNISDIA